MIKLVATDLDGTFLRNDKSVSEKNRDSLELLGRKHVVRVAATGRNLRKVREVIAPEIPFDYIIFSSGAGIFDWQDNQLVFGQNITPGTSRELAGYLVGKGLNFFAFRAVPDNHYLWYHRGATNCAEFERYFSFHNSFAAPLPADFSFGVGLAQFLVLLPGDANHFLFLKDEIESLFEEIGVIRSTSPLGTGFIWMEIFHKSISKGNALAFICRKEGIDSGVTIGIGNDYNDLELLEFTKESFLVANSPKELLDRFSVAPSNEEDAFSYVVGRYFAGE